MIRAYDKAGGYSSDSVSVTVDYSNPSTAQVTSISNGFTYDGDITITGIATDSYTSIDRIEFWDGLPGSGKLSAIQEGATGVERRGRLA